MFLIVSKDKEEIRRELAKVVLKDVPATSFYPDNFTTEAFFQEVETPPFLSKTKQVILHEIDQLSKETQDMLLRFLEKPSPWISLFLTAKEFSSQSKVAKCVEKKGKVVRIKEEKPWEKEKRLAEWLACEAKARGVQFSIQAASALVKAVSPSTLQCELEKLLCFVGKRKEITLEDVSIICCFIHHETLWQLGDAIFAVERANALKIGRILLEEGMAIFPLLAHMRSQFSTGMDILDAARLGELGSKFPYLKGKILEKKLFFLKNYGKERLQRGVMLIFEAEIQAKSSIDPTLVLELLIVKL